MSHCFVISAHHMTRDHAFIYAFCRELATIIAGGANHG